jgi:HK97 gp10 family phage protein
MGYNADMVSTKVIWNGEREKKQMNSAMIVTLNRGINIVDADAKSLTPVDTGLLRSDNEKSVNNSKLIARETNNTEYAGYVEFGTSRQRAQPFLRPALIKNSKKIINIAKQEAKKASGN